MIKCLPRLPLRTSSPWSKCLAIPPRRKWSWTILSHSISGYNLVCVVVQGLCVAQRADWSSGANQCWKYDTRDYDYRRGAYDIETIIAMLNASDALFKVVYSGERTRSTSRWITSSTRSISRTQQRSNRSSDSNRTAWWKELSWQSETGYTYMSTSCKIRWLLLTALTRACWYCLVDTTRSASSSRLLATRWWKCYNTHPWRSRKTM